MKVEIPNSEDTVNREQADASPKHFLRSEESAAPFTVRRVVLVDFDRREALCDLGRGGAAWVQLDGFPISNPCWRALPDNEFVKLARNFRILRSAR